jgi:hypothetical protein
MIRVYKDDRIDIRTSVEIKSILRKLSELDNRSLTKELECIIMEKYNKLKLDKL